VTLLVFHHSEYGATETTFDTFVKSSAIARSLREDPIPGVVLAEPEPVDRSMLLEVHDAVYVDAVLTGRPLDLASSNELGWDPGLARAVCRSTGGVVAAARTALCGATIAGSLSSGLHHAHPGHGRGYCTINGLAVAASAARRDGAGRILVLDLDAHCGGGTAAILALGRLPGVEQLDVSVDPFDEYEPHATARLVRVDGPCYLSIVGRELDGIRDPAGIELVLYNAGVDPHHRAGGVVGIDDAVIAAREALVFDWCAEHGLAVAFVLAGGYVHGVETAPGVQGIDAVGLVALHRTTIAAAGASVERRSAS
jgi:acetoin utilization deacetylase AcuC-like enzyme